MGLRFDVISPCDGIIERVKVTKGDRVEEGTAIFFLKANGSFCEIFAPVSGRIEAVEVDQGDVTISGMILAVILQDDSGRHV